MKVNLLKNTRFPDGVKAKGETVETDQSTADWLIKVGAAEAEKAKPPSQKNHPKPKSD